MAEYIAMVRDTLGYTAEVLDLGGGIAVPCVFRDPVADLDACVRDICEHLAERCDEPELPIPVVLMEPGRSIVADAAANPTLSSGRTWPSSGRRWTTPSPSS